MQAKLNPLRHTRTSLSREDFNARLYYSCECLNISLCEVETCFKRRRNTVVLWMLVQSNSRTSQADQWGNSGERRSLSIRFTESAFLSASESDANFHELTNMELFDVPGWRMPGAQLNASNSRKRKRPHAIHEDGSSSKVHTAQVNMDKLMERLAQVENASKVVKKSKDKPAKKAKNIPQLDSGQNTASRDKKEKQLAATSAHEGSTLTRKGGKKSVDLAENGAAKCMESPGSGSPVEKMKKKSKKESRPSNELTNMQQPESNFKSHLTDLQSKMKLKLDGARFR
jgi:hypothetical protein